LARAWCIRERARKGLPAVQGFARTPAGFFPRPLRRRFESVWVKPSPPSSPVDKTIKGCYNRAQEKDPSVSSLIRRRHAGGL